MVKQNHTFVNIQKKKILFINNIEKHFINNIERDFHLDYSILVDKSVFYKEKRMVGLYVCFHKI